MVAIGVLAAAALALLAAFTAGLKMMTESRDIAMATEVGQEFLETVERGGYPATSLGVFDGGTPTLQDVSSGFPPQPYPSGRRDDTEYTLRVECEQYAPRARTVRVQVRWGRQRLLEFLGLVDK